MRFLLEINYKTNLSGKQYKNRSSILPLMGWTQKFILTISHQIEVRYIANDEIFQFITVFTTKNYRCQISGLLKRLRNILTSTSIKCQKPVSYGILTSLKNDPGFNIPYGKVTPGSKYHMEKWPRGHFSSILFWPPSWKNDPPPCKGGLKYHNRGVKIPWQGRSKYHGRGVKIPWQGGRNTMTNQSLIFESWFRYMQYQQLVNCRGGSKYHGREVEIPWQFKLSNF